MVGSVRCQIVQLIQCICGLDLHIVLCMDNYLRYQDGEQALDLLIVPLES